MNDLELADRWILARYQQVVLQTRHQIDTYGLGEAAKGLYEFIWRDLCDWYIELVKPRLRQEETPSRRIAQQTLAYVLEGTLKLLHPFMPHITEEIWQTLTQTEENRYLALQAYPKLEDPEETVVAADPTEMLQGDTTAEANRTTLPSALEVTANTPEISDGDGRDWAMLLGDLPILILETLQAYRHSLINLGLLLGGILVVMIALAVAKMMLPIPILGWTFECIGLGYTLYFALSNLLWHEDRQALGRSLQNQKQKILPVLEASKAQKGAIPVASTTVMAQLPPTPPVSTLRALMETDIETQFELLIGTIRTIRNLRAETKHQTQFAHQGDSAIRARS